MGVGKAPSTKRHQCLFVFGMDPWLRKGAENTPLAGGYRGRHAFSVVVDVDDSQENVPF